MGQELVLLGYLWNKREYKEPAFENETDFKGDATKNGSIIIKDLSVNNSGVYFCAVSLHSDLIQCHLCTKTSFTVFST